MELDQEIERKIKRYNLQKEKEERKPKLQNEKEERKTKRYPAKGAGGAEGAKG